MPTISHLGDGLEAFCVSWWAAVSLREGCGKQELKPALGCHHEYGRLAMLGVCWLRKSWICAAPLFAWERETIRDDSQVRARRATRNTQTGGEYRRFRGDGIKRNPGKLIIVADLVAISR